MVAVLPLARSASAQTGVQITTSADAQGGKFFGPAFVEVRIDDQALRNDSNNQSTNIPITVTAFGTTNTVLASETSASSGMILFYVKVDQNGNTNDITGDTLVGPANPLSTTANSWTKLVVGTSGTDVGTSTAYGTNGGQAVVKTFTVGTISEGGSITFSYGGQTKTFTYASTPATITLDRSNYGPGATMYVRVNEPDINLDPTSANTFTMSGNNLVTGTDVGAALQFKETGANTGIFEAPTTITALSGTTESTSRSATVKDFKNFVDAGSSAVNLATSPTQFGSSDVSYVVQKVRGVIQTLPAMNYTSEMPIVVSDSDRNLDSRTQEFVNAAPTLQVGGQDYKLREKNLNSDQFVPAFTNDRIKVTWKSPTSSGVAATDAANGVFFSRPGNDILVAYNDASTGFTNPTSQITFQIPSGTPTLTTTATQFGKASTVALTLNDPNLNDDSGVQESYTFTFAAAGTSTNTINAADGAAALKLEARIAGNLQTMASAFTITFTETGANTGVFTANVRLGDFATATGHTFTDGESVKFEVTDQLDQNLVVSPKSDVSFTIGLQKPTIELDRTTLGSPRDRSVSAVDTNIGTPNPTITGAYANLGDQVFHITINDPASNTDSQVQNVIQASALNQAVASGGSTFGGGKLKLTFLDKNNANFGAAGSIDITDAIQETGLDTGIFSGTITVHFNGPGVSAGDNPDTWIGSKLKIEYAGADAVFGNIDDADSKSVTFTARNAVLTVNGTATTGGSLVFTVKDDDANRDPTKVDQVSVEIKESDSAAPRQLKLDETGPNTGIFTKTRKIGTDTYADGTIMNVAADQDFKVRYYELSPNSSGTWPAANNVNGQIDLTLRSAAATGGLVLTPEKVGPGTQIRLTVTDNDLNTNPQSKQTTTGRVTAASDRDGTGIVNRADVTIEETAPNSGVFTAKVKLSPQGGGNAGPGTEVTLNALPGDVVSVRYDDEKGVNGQRTTVSKTVQVISQDPVMNYSKTGYNVGDSIILTINDADANRDPDVADTLPLRVTSTSDAVGLSSVQGIETGPNTGVFVATIQTSKTFSTGALMVSNGDTVTTEYTDSFPASFRQKFDLNGSLTASTQKFRINTTIGAAPTTGSTTPSKPALADITGATITEVTTGQQVVLTTNVKNNDDSPRPFVAIVEVRDSDGITQMLQWQTGSMAASGNAGVGISWVPEKAGTYEVRTFVISSLSNPQVLSDVVTTNVTVS